MKIRNRILLGVILLTLIPLLGLGAFVYWHFSTSIEQRAVSSAEKLGAQFNQNLDLLVEDAARMTLSPLYDGTIVNILKKYNPSANFKLRSHEDVEKLSLFLSGFQYEREHMYGVHIVANNGAVFSHMDTYRVKPVIDLSTEPWVKDLEHSQGKWVFIPLHHPSYYQQPLSKPLVSVARLLRDPADHSPVGYIKVDFKPDLLHSMTTNLAAGDWLIVDERERVLFQSENSHSASSTYSFDYGATRITLEGDDYLVVSNQSRYTKVKVLTFLPEGEIFQELRWFNFWFTMIVLISLTLSIALSIVASKKFLTPLERLKNKMKAIQNGDLKQRIEVPVHDEIGELGEVFNEMMDELDFLMKEVYEMGMRKTKAELKALQSQMAPHFMYNTLEAISMVAMSKREFEISDMISALGNMMRYVLKQDQDMVTLRNEIGFVREYVTIIEFRKGEQISVHWDIDEELLDTPIPKFTLQPIVENAINHGVGDMENGSIWIRTVKKADKVVIIIEDNGIGMDRAVLENIVASVNHLAGLAGGASVKEEAVHNGIAMNNIQRRLHMFFGLSYGLQIYSESGIGTAVHIIIPLKGENVRDQSHAG
ncbi:cache domain-containing sensor histidine kinase [Paenibacillus senegalensis]|uniref:cache domain-containing sensor histidine kinase n=1 Tax=Paenibacillus senegalensis TaxID=1465766 RepID=UPI0002893F4C|nr:sensor histidine kinase [Paenibacillus senegalensis]